MPRLKYLALKEAKTLSTREVSLRDETGHGRERRVGKARRATMQGSDRNKEKGRKSK